MKITNPGAERVARVLLEGGPATAGELATRLGLSATVVRRHLDVLLAEGFVSASDRAPFGPAPVRGRGRPARVFTLTEQGSDVFDHAYDDLAASALRFLRDMGGDAAVTEFARRRSAEWERRHRADIDGALPERLHAVAEALSADGYAAQVVDGQAPDGHESGAVQVCQHHCPVAHVAGEFPQLCEAETEAIGRLLGTHVLRIATIAHGDGVCTTLVPALNTRRSAS